MSKMNPTVVLKIKRKKLYYMLGLVKNSIFSFDLSLCTTTINA
jgi:hypothetical protein